MKELVLIPGVGCNVELWAEQIARLKDIANCHVMILDEQESLEEMVDYVLEHAPEKFSIAGHSLGGWLAPVIAAKAPDRVEKLMIMQAFASQPEEFWDGIQHFIDTIQAGQLQSLINNELAPMLFHDSNLSNTDMINRYKHMVSQMSAEKYVRQFKAMMANKSVVNILNKIVAPTLIISGRQDEGCPVSAHEEINEHIKGSTHIVLEKCGHFCNFEQAEATTALMRLWLMID